MRFGPLPETRMYLFGKATWWIPVSKDLMRKGRLIPNLCVLWSLHLKESTHLVKIGPVILVLIFCVLALHLLQEMSFSAM